MSGQVNAAVLTTTLGWRGAEATLAYVGGALLASFSCVGVVAVWRGFWVKGVGSAFLGGVEAFTSTAIEVSSAVILPRRLEYSVEGAGVGAVVSLATGTKRMMRLSLRKWSKRLMAAG
jgi:hypothetical protein